EAVGLRDLSPLRLDNDAPAGQAPTTRAAPPAFKQYREADGRLYFKLVQGEQVLLQSHAFDAPRDAGQAIAALRRGTVSLAQAPAALGEGVDEARVRAALDALAAADAERDAKEAA